MIKRLLKRLWDGMMSWAGDHPAASWWIHFSICFIASNVLAFIHHYLLLIVAIIMGCYFLYKEIGDWRKYRHGEVQGGVSKTNDGWGDLLGPVAFLAGVVSAWYWIV